MSRDIKKFSESVRQELTEMRKIGMKVSDKAVSTTFNEKMMEPYLDMKVSECADLLKDLYE